MEILIKDGETIFVNGTITPNASPPNVITDSKGKDDPLQKQIDRAGQNGTLTLQSKIYRERIRINHSFTLKGQPGTVISAWTKLSENHTPSSTGGHIFYRDPIPGLNYKSSKQAPEWHVKAGNPINISLSQGNRPNDRQVFKQVFSVEAYEKGVRDDLPVFWVQGTYNNFESILVHSPHGNYDDIEIARFPVVIQVQNTGGRVYLQDINVDGSAATRKQGAIQASGQNFSAKNVNVFNANTFGWRLRELRSATLIDCGGIGCRQGAIHGVMLTAAVFNGWFESMSNMGPSGEELFDSSWETSKIERSSGVTIDTWLARRVNGPGLWFDIDNKKWTAKNVTVKDTLRAGIQIEDRSVSGALQDFKVQGVRKGGRRDTSVGLQIQSGIVDCVFKDGEIEGSKDYAILYKKDERTTERPPSGRNTFSNIKSKGIFAIEGTSNMADKTTDVPEIKRW